MENAILAIALSSTAKTFEAALARAEGITALPEERPSLRAQTPSPQEPSLTIASIFALSPPALPILALPNRHYPPPTYPGNKPEKRHASIWYKHDGRVTKSSSRSVWKATPRLRAQTWRELKIAREAARRATTRIVPFRGIPYGPNIITTTTTTSLPDHDDSKSDDASTLAFPGQVYVQEPVAAISVALAEKTRGRVDREDGAQRFVFWVDASSQRGTHKGAGFAVVYRGGRKAKKWITRGYSVREKHLSITVIETLAIAQALHEALCLVEKEPPPRPGSKVVVYSDSQAALERILSYGVAPWRFGDGIIELIIIKATELRRRDVRVFLHWVPSHQHVPGNELADWVARLASDDGR